MPGVFWNSSLFWMGFFLIGVTLTVMLYRLPTVEGKASRMPRVVQRIFALTFYLLPALILPLIPQPRLAWPIPVDIGAGVALLIASIIIRRIAHQALGAHPALRQKSGLVTTGIYSRIRHPMYLSNILLAVGWALLFRAIHAFACAPVWVVGYGVLIFFEEKALEKAYGQIYYEYKTEVPWRIVPRLF